MAKPIPYDDTTVSVAKSVAEIEDMLAVHKCEAVMKEYESGRIKGVAFRMQGLNYKMPVETDRLAAYFVGKWGNNPQHRYRTPDAATKARLHEQAERTAWRNAAAWVKVQLAYAEIGCVEIAQVMLPFRLLSDGRTAYQALKDGGIPVLGPGDGGPRG